MKRNVTFVTCRRWAFLALAAVVIGWVCFRLLCSDEMVAMPSAEGHRGVPSISPSLAESSMSPGLPESAVAERMSTNVGIGLSGSVAWANGDPLRGATVRFEKVAAVGLTDHEGRYSLVVKPDEWEAMSPESGKSHDTVSVQAPCWQTPRVGKVSLVELDGAAWRAVHSPFERECDIVVDVDMAQALAKALAEAGISGLRVDVMELYPTIAANTIQKRLAKGESLCGSASLVLTVPWTTAAQVRLQFLRTDSSQGQMWFPDAPTVQLSLLEVGRVVFRLGSLAMLQVEVADSQGMLLPRARVTVWRDTPGMPDDRDVERMVADEYGRLLLIGEPGSRRGVVARHAGNASPENASPEVVFMIGQSNARVVVPTAGMRQVSIREAGRTLQRFVCDDYPFLFGQTMAPNLPYHQGGSCWVPSEAREVFVAWQEGSRPREALLPLPNSADRYVVLDLAELRPPNNIQVRIVFGKVGAVRLAIEMLHPLASSLVSRRRIVMPSTTQDQSLLGFVPGTYRIAVRRGLDGPTLVQRDVQWSEDAVVDVADWIESER
ncbi:MAG: hypothetical protein ACK58T_36000 [Phycisphaerae bacterium]|jgi:hypothetical protein